MNDELDKAIAAASGVEEQPRVVINAGIYNDRSAQIVLPGDTTDEELLYIVSVVAAQGRAALIEARQARPSPIVTRPKLVVPVRN